VCVCVCVCVCMCVYVHVCMRVCISAAIPLVSSVSRLFYRPSKVHKSTIGLNILYYKGSIWTVFVIFDCQ